MNSRTYTQKFLYPTFANSSGRKMPDTGGWQARHWTALLHPQGAEIPLVNLIGAWALYADEHKRRYEAGIRQDYVLGPEWANIGKALRGLLNGEAGRLDCGTLDGFINDALIAEGYGEEPFQEEPRQ